MGIHYDYKSTRGMKAMEKQAKRETKEGKKKEEDVIKLNVQEPITLDFITNPNKNKWPSQNNLLKKKLVNLN